MANRSAHRKTVILAVAMAFSLCVTPALFAGDGYLTTVGPSDLRFSPPLRPAPKEFLALIAKQALPPVKPETNAAPAVVVPQQPDPATNAVVTVSKSPDPVNQTPAQMAPVVGAVPTDDTVSPQMLIPYFNNNRTRRGNDGGVIVPVNIPSGSTPQPAASPSSKATYTNGNDTPR